MRKIPLTNLFSENDPAPIRKGAPFPESDLFRGRGCNNRTKNIKAQKESETRCFLSFFTQKPQENKARLFTQSGAWVGRRAFFMS